LGVGAAVVRARHDGLPLDASPVVVMADARAGDRVVLETGSDDNAARYEVRRAVVRVPV